MTELPFLVRIFVLCIAASVIPLISGNSEIYLGRMTVSNDFEANNYSPWGEESPGPMRWTVENYTTPWEPSAPAPKPRSGSRFLRAVRDSSSYAGGFSELRSPFFTVSPGDSVSFNYWLRSNETQGTKLELYWVENDVERLLADIQQPSTDSNFIWLSKTVDIPVTTTTQVSLVFYAFLLDRLGDAVAIDDVAISSTIDQPAGCNHIFTELSGTFTTLNYPNNYPDNSYCGWIIVLDETLRSTVVFDTILTENNTDIITVHDGPTSLGPVLGRFSGSYNSSNLPAPITGKTNMMLITFTSDASVNSTGFSASFSAGEEVITTPVPTPPSEICGGEFLGHGEIETPNYPELYPKLVDCYWYLDTESVDQRISLVFQNFSMANVYDWVSVYEGWDVSNGETLLFRYSGNHAPWPVETNKTSKMLVHFHSENLTTIFSFGFSAYFSTDLIDPRPELPPPTEVCNTELTGHSGKFEPPKYPNNTVFYDNNLNCKWTITVEWPYRVQVTFTAIYMADSGDYITVYNGNSTSSPIIAQTGGAAAPISPRSTGQSITVGFITDEYNTTSAWSATYSYI